MQMNYSCRNTYFCARQQRLHPQPPTFFLVALSTFLATADRHVLARAPSNPKLPLWLPTTNDCSRSAKQSNLVYTANRTRSTLERWHLLEQGSRHQGQFLADWSAYKASTREHVALNLERRSVGSVSKQQPSVRHCWQLNDKSVKIRKPHNEDGSFAPRSGVASSIDGTKNTKRSS